MPQYKNIQDTITKYLGDMHALQMHGLAPRGYRALDRPGAGTRTHRHLRLPLAPRIRDHSASLTA